MVEYCQTQIMARTKYEIIHGKKPDGLCTAFTRAGERCRYKACAGTLTCGIHTTKVECPVCYETKRDKKLSCGHTLCHDCAKEWLRTNNTCPMCRAVVSKPQARRYNEVSRLWNQIEEIEHLAQSYIAMRMAINPDPAALQFRLEAVAARNLVSYFDLVA